MKRTHRILAAGAMLAPASAPAPAAHRGTTTSAIPPADAGPDATVAPATTSTEPAPPSTAAVASPAAAGDATTTVTVTIPATTRAPRTTTTFTVPEKAEVEGLSDEEWWEAQPGFVPGACGGSLPPCWVMQRESGGNIHVYNRQGSGASGKWQFMPGTWASYGGYANAADAPEWVQDEKARQVSAGGRGCFHWDARRTGDPWRSMPGPRSLADVVPVDPPVPFMGGPGPHEDVGAGTSMTAVALPAGRVFLLHRTFPCCGGRSRFLVEADSYERTCRSCGSRWTVRRITRAPSDFARRSGVRVDALEWERAVTE